MRKIHPATIAKKVEERIDGLTPVNDTELEEIVASGRAIVLDILQIRGDNTLGFVQIPGVLKRAKEIHAGRAEGAELKDMIYGGYSHISKGDHQTGRDGETEIYNIFSPEAAKTSPLKPKLLRMYKKPDGTFVLDFPVNGFRCARHK